MTRPADILPEPDHMTIELVAARFGKKRWWLESRLEAHTGTEKAAMKTQPHRPSFLAT